MILRNPRESVDGHMPENVFELLEPRTGRLLGQCIVTEESWPMLFPERPYQVHLDINCDASGMDMLIGAALARARALCAAQDQPARIYTSCDPRDDERLDQLRQYGFRDNDGIMRMRAQLPLALNRKPPVGCVLIEDKLDDFQEQQYFLERCNELYGEVRDMKWLADVIKRNGFKRMLTVASTGMAGEIAAWHEGGIGVIEFFDTARRWRNLGVAGYMISLACDYLRQNGARLVYADVRVRAPHARRTLESAGFYAYELLTRYPGIDL